MHSLKHLHLFILPAREMLPLHGKCCPCTGNAAPAREMLPLHGKCCPCTGNAAPAREVLPLHGKCCPCTGSAAPAREVLPLHGKCFQAACFDRTGSLKRLCRCQTCQTGSIFGNHQFFVGWYHHCQRIITFSNNACFSETSFCIELIVNLQAQEA